MTVHWIASTIYIGTIIGSARLNIYLWARIRIICITIETHLALLNSKCNLSLDTVASHLSAVLNLAKIKFQNGKIGSVLLKQSLCECSLSRRIFQCQQYPKSPELAASYVENNEDPLLAPGDYYHTVVISAQSSPGSDNSDRSACSDIWLSKISLAVRFR